MISPFNLLKACYIYTVSLYNNIKTKACEIKDKVTSVVYKTNTFITTEWNTYIAQQSTILIFSLCMIIINVCALWWLNMTDFLVINLFINMMSINFHKLFRTTYDNSLDLVHDFTNILLRTMYFSYLYNVLATQTYQGYAYNMAYYTTISDSIIGLHILAHYLHHILVHYRKEKVQAIQYYCGIIFNLSLCTVQPYALYKLLQWTPPIDSFNHLGQGYQFDSMVYHYSFVTGISILNVLNIPIFFKSWYELHKEFNKSQFKKWYAMYEAEIEEQIHDIYG